MIQSEWTQRDTRFLKAVYSAGLFALIFMLAMIPVQIVFYLLWPHPAEIHDWFMLFNTNWIIGLISFDFLYLLSMVASIFLYIALFIALEESNKVLSLFAAILGLMGLAIYFPTNTSIEMLTTARMYMNGGTEYEKTILLASGQTLYSIWKGTAYGVYYVFNGVALILFFISMKKSCHFRRSTAYIGLSSGVLMLIPATAGIIGMIMSLLSLIPWSIFSIFAIRDFSKMIKEMKEI